MVMEIIRKLATADNTAAIFILGLVLLAMILDFLTGYAAAWSDKRVTSSIGINGLLRKAVSIIILISIIPLLALFPPIIGDSALMVIYMSYLVFEWTSILENLRKLGINIGPLEKILGMLKAKEESLDIEVKEVNKND